jgi:hypothetical protein
VKGHNFGGVIIHRDIQGGWIRQGHGFLVVEKNDRISLYCMNDADLLPVDDVVTLGELLVVDKL